MTTLDENIDYVEANHAALLAKYILNQSRKKCEEQARPYQPSERRR